MTEQNGGVNEQRPRHRGRVAGIGLLVTLAVVLGITMWPIPVDTGSEGTIRELLSMLHSAGVSERFGYVELEFCANIVMFMPVGFFIAALFRRRMRWLVIFIVPVLSLAIEGAQLLFLPARFAAVSDVVANSLGGWIGLLALVALSALTRSKESSMTPRSG